VDVVYDRPSRRGATLDDEESDPEAQAERLSMFALLVAIFLAASVFAGAFWLLVIAD
jgi:hypothetical protein